LGRFKAKNYIISLVGTLAKRKPNSVLIVAGTLSAVGSLEARPMIFK
jgi:hypothetical protein